MQRASRDDDSTLRRAPDADGARIAAQLSSAQQSSSQFSNSGQLRPTSLFVVSMHALTTRARVTHGRAHGARPSRFLLNIFTRLLDIHQAASWINSITAQSARGRLSRLDRLLMLPCAPCGRANERALLACILVACLDVHMLVVHMPLCWPARCVSQLQARQPASMCIQSVSQLHLGSPLRKFRSVQFSSAIGYRLSVIGYRLSVISPHVVVRMPFDLDPCF